jgi:glycosyltransferase involved in cell wall biosynthesis
LRIISASRFHRIKNIEYFVDELVELKDCNIDVVFIGDYNNEYGQNILRKTNKFSKVRINEFPIYNSKDIGLVIHFLGLKSRKEVISEMNSSDIFVQCSHTEGLSNSVLEALAVGLEVIISKGCRMSDYKVENGLTQINCKKGELTNILRKKLNNDDSVEIAQKSARKLYDENFSIEYLSKKILNQLDMLGI